jgi:hypothetical protein
VCGKINVRFAYISWDLQTTSAVGAAGKILGIYATINSTTFMIWKFRRNFASSCGHKLARIEKQG